LKDGGPRRAPAWRAPQWRFWVFLGFVFLLFLYSVQEVVFPFLVGLLLAYFLDPLVCVIERRWGLGRGAASSLVMVGFSALLLGVLAAVGPVIFNQVGELLGQLPSLAAQLRDEVREALSSLQERYDIDIRDRIRELVGNYAEVAITTVVNVGIGLVQGGVALVNIVSLVLITPLVAFYCLVQWRAIIRSGDSLLPQRHRSRLRALIGEIDQTLDGFIRGQALVCTVMATYYATVLTISGLNYGAAIGLIAGVLTFIPYIGALTGFLLTVGIAVSQFSFPYVLLPIGLYVLGQSVEGNFLTPRLVGRAVNLHDVWVLFAVLAGGALAGFIGVLIAVPVAGVLGVLVRFAAHRYQESRYYLGDDETDR